LLNAQTTAELCPDAFGGDGPLAGHVAALRKALAAEQEAEEVIQTVHKSGYRFVAEVEESVPTPLTAEQARPQQLAILPFKPLSPSHDDPVFELGLADTLIARLSLVPNLRVRPISPVRGFIDPEQDPLAAGRELRVDTVLDGTLHREGDRLRLTARLMRVADGQTLWSRTFEEALASVFALEDMV